MGAGGSANISAEKAAHASNVLAAVNAYNATLSKREQDELDRTLFEFKRKIKSSAHLALQRGNDISASLAQLTEADLETMRQFINKKQLVNVPVSIPTNIQGLSSSSDLDKNISLSSVIDDNDNKDRLIDDIDDLSVLSYVDEIDDGLLADNEAVDETSANLNAIPDLDMSATSLALHQARNKVENSPRTNEVLAELKRFSPSSESTNSDPISPSANILPRKHLPKNNITPTTLNLSNEAKDISPLDASSQEKKASPSDGMGAKDGSSEKAPSKSPSKLFNLTTSPGSPMAPSEYKEHGLDAKGSYTTEEKKATGSPVSPSMTIQRKLASSPSPFKNEILGKPLQQQYLDIEESLDSEEMPKSLKLMPKPLTSLSTPAEVIDAKNEALMGLQRQKVWSYAKNAQLQKEVDDLQKQLAMMESMDAKMGLAPSDSIGDFSIDGLKSKHYVALGGSMLPGGLSAMTPSLDKPEPVTRTELSPEIGGGAASFASRNAGLVKPLQPLPMEVAAPKYGSRADASSYEHRNNGNRLRLKEADMTPGSKVSHTVHSHTQGESALADDNFVYKGNLSIVGHAGGSNGGDATHPNRNRNQDSSPFERPTGPNSTDRAHRIGKPYRSQPSIGLSPRPADKGGLRGNRSHQSHPNISVVGNNRSNQNSPRADADKKPSPIQNSNGDTGDSKSVGNPLLKPVKGASSKGTRALRVPRRRVSQPTTTNNTANVTNNNDAKGTATDNEDNGALNKADLDIHNIANPFAGNSIPRGTMTREVAVPRDLRSDMGAAQAVAEQSEEANKRRSRRLRPRAVRNLAEIGATSDRLSGVNGSTATRPADPNTPRSRPNNKQKKLLALNGSNEANRDVMIQRESSSTDKRHNNNHSRDDRGVPPPLPVNAAPPKTLTSVSPLSFEHGLYSNNNNDNSSKAGDDSDNNSGVYTIGATSEHKRSSMDGNTSDSDVSDTSAARRRRGRNVLKNANRRRRHTMDTMDKPADSLTPTSSTDAASIDGIRGNGGIPKLGRLPEHSTVQSMEREEMERQRKAKMADNATAKRSPRNNATNGISKVARRKQQKLRREQLQKEKDTSTATNNGNSIEKEKLFKQRNATGGGAFAASNSNSSTTHNAKHMDIGDANRLSNKDGAEAQTSQATEANSTNTNTNDSNSGRRPLRLKNLNNKNMSINTQWSEPHQPEHKDMVTPEMPNLPVEGSTANTSANSSEKKKKKDAGPSVVEDGEMEESVDGEMSFDQWEKQNRSKAVKKRRNKIKNLGPMEAKEVKIKRREALEAKNKAKQQQIAEEEEKFKGKTWSRSLYLGWSEVTLLLRKRIEKEDDLVYTISAAEAGMAFTEQLNSVARQLNVLRGTLSRWLLPFDNNTRLDEQCSTPTSVVENMPDEFRGKLTERQVHYLVAGANSVRRLVRIKIADDNDLDQAREAMKTAIEFFRSLQETASKNSMTPWQLLEPEINK